MLFNFFLSIATLVTVFVSAIAVPVAEPGVEGATEILKRDPCGGLGGISCDLCMIDPTFPGC
ncbi:hypothetical protein SISSUDRAFT_1045621 [Sistotremastrum suecicum HHB10207 ss-3]|uniref:Uncharacterized protein n=1 Tax=Sistotremastrum suecicum HHB10207 ss-3 TaxID=1314776 RepID=A0A166ECK8_9AGAM|nr:hypothetical protein SISSUDRAFT_1045621 [Sistotremastrum suecicum HHB10207 ss-3]